MELTACGGIGAVLVNFFCLNDLNRTLRHLPWSFLDFTAVNPVNPLTSRKDILFDPPPGPGGRRSTPDSAMRPRAPWVFRLPSS